MNASGQPRDVPMDRTVAESLGPDDPREIGRFTVIGLLGTGGMGEVYLGTAGEGYVAVKRVRPHLVPGERFQREVGILYRVPVGVAPRVLATDGTVSRPWFATEYVPGLTVDEAVRLGGPLAAETLWLLLAETAARLHAVHDVGIVHRDLKPANVMLVRDGVKLIDFGIARAADQARLTRSGGSYGTRGFTAPEQDAGDEDVAAPADVYALGALMVYAASGRTPGVVPDIEAMRAVDEDLADIVASCLAVEPGARLTASALEELARTRVAADQSWPPLIVERIEARRTFAATPVRKLVTIPPPDELAAATAPAAAAAAVPALDQVPTAQPEPETTVRQPTRRSRRKYVVLPIAGVIAVGAVVAYVLVPDISSARSGALAGGGSASLSGASMSAATALVSSGRPSPSASGSLATSTAAGAAATVPADYTAYTTPPPACSAWLDSDGSGDLAGVLNTSQEQACGAELFRSDGVAFTFHQSTAAAKTNFISDQGYSMYICVWNQSSPSSKNCGNSFTMSGTTPVEGG